MPGRHLVALSAAALTAAIMVVPSPAGAARTSAATPAAIAAMHGTRSYEWRPGQKLPHVPEGFWLVAWPPEKVMKTLRPGQTVPVEHVRAASKATEIRRYRHVENRGGIINLLVEYAGKHSGASADSPAAAPCRPSAPVFEKAIGSKAATVAQSYSTIKHVTQHFKYGTGQVSSAEFGISLTGDDGTFGGSGTMAVTSDGSWTFTPQSGRNFVMWRTYFEWGLYYTHTTGLCGNVYLYYERPYQVNGGSAYKHPPGAPKATACVPAHKSDHYSGRTTTASTIRTGFDVLGLKGSMQTGYDSTAEISIIYHLVKGQRAKACGTKNYPLSPDPGVLVASK